MNFRFILDLHLKAKGFFVTILNNLERDEIEEKEKRDTSFKFIRKLLVRSLELFICFIENPTKIKEIVWSYTLY